VKKVLVRKVSLNHSDCESAIKTEKVDYGPGFYQFVHADEYKSRSSAESAGTESRAAETEGAFLKELRQKY
jgi:hypothetical protein